MKYLLSSTHPPSSLLKTLIRETSGMRMNGVYTVLLLVIYVSLATEQVFATQHQVTWDVSTDLNSWASARTFKVGDQLVFKYSSGMHSVLELSSEKEYKNCDIGTALNSMNGGKDVVKLTKSGTRYFACGTLGHCDQGMKLSVKTVAATGSPSQDSTPSSDSPQDSTPSSSDKTTSTTSTSAPHVSAASSLILAASVIAALFNLLV